MSRQEAEAVDTPDVDEPEVDEQKVEGTANVGETSVEINVDELIAELEAERPEMEQSDSGARKKLEEILEQKRIAQELEDIEDFEDFDLAH